MERIVLSPILQFIRNLELFLWINDQIDAQLHYIKRFNYNPLHVSSNTVLIRRANCIDTAFDLLMMSKVLLETYRGL